MFNTHTIRFSFLFFSFLFACNVSHDERWMLRDLPYCSASSLGVAATAFVEFAEEASAIRASSQAVQIFGLHIGDRMCQTRHASECKSLYLYTLSGNPISTETE